LIKKSATGGRGWPKGAHDERTDHAGPDFEHQQLFETLTAWSADQAVLVAGDFNLTRGELPVLERLATEAGLRDACRILRCADPRRLDRILYRGSPALALRARQYRVDTSFRDEAGRQLSDHLPVAVTVDWTSPSP
jgi:endonuclease/exonuclease/phosphatase family metal-dependent hydrolase